MQAVVDFDYASGNTTGIGEFLADGTFDSKSQALVLKPKSWSTAHPDSVLSFSLTGERCLARLSSAIFSSRLCFTVRC